MIQCNHCHKQYIEETKRRLKDCLNEHRRPVDKQTNSSNPITLSEHFWCNNHSATDLQLIPLEKGAPTQMGTPEHMVMRYASMQSKLVLRSPFSWWLREEEIWDMRKSWVSGILVKAKLKERWRSFIVVQWVPSCTEFSREMVDR